ncbi:MAG: M23 family metallopeptidase [Acidimicrobiia bacterium]|nr:M23 family metallopeptidase [Acidimicrobiia bacterium]MDX2466163.1 M23 family metallopeptidase [Acidimicrobiia bacterium]
MSRNRFRQLVVALVAASFILPTAALAATDEFRLVYFPHEDITSAFSNDWGDARSGGRSHLGTDIFGHKHSAVVAVADGFVTKMAESSRSGFHVRIEHRDGWESWYMHLNNDSLGTDDGSGGTGGAFPEDIEVGMFVAAGTVIGYVGDSGNAEGSSSHTHFELHNGRAVNPYPYLADAYDRWIRVMQLADEVR